MGAIQIANESYKASRVNDAFIASKLPMDSEEYLHLLMSKLAAMQHRVFEPDEEWGNQLEED